MNLFKFLRPEYLFLFLPLAFLLLLFFRRRKNQGDLSKICSQDLLPYMLVEPKKRSLYPFFLIPFTLSLLIFSLSGPSWNKIELPLYKDQSALLILLDLSESMNSQDIKPSRLKRALYKIQDLLKMEKTKQIGLVVFSGEAFVVTPLTEDKGNIEAQIPALKPSIMPSRGHRTDLAIKKAFELLKQAGIKKGSLLLLTAELSSDELKKSTDLLNEEMIKGGGINLSIIGIGDEQKSPVAKEEGGFLKNETGSLVMSALSFENLQKLANRGGGIYVKSTVDEKDLIEISRAFTSSNGEKNKKEEFQQDSQQEEKDEGYLLLLLALPLVLFLFRRGLLISLVPLFFFLAPKSIEAIDLSSFFQTDDKQAETYFLEGEYGLAKELFKNEEWKACSHYHLGEYESAAELFSRSGTADGFYNYGTAKAKLGEFEEALKAYAKTLELDPNHEDAKYNKEMIEEYLKQQKSDSSPKENDKGGDESKGDNSKEDNSKKDSKEQKKETENKENEAQNDKTEDDKERDKESSENEEKDREEQDQKQNEEQNENQKIEDKNEENGKEESLENEQEEDESEEPQNKFEQTIDERLLKRVKDDPSELLRRKFLQQYKKIDKNKKF